MNDLQLYWKGEVGRRQGGVYLYVKSNLNIRDDIANGAIEEVDVVEASKRRNKQ